MENLTADEVVKYLARACPDVSPESIQMIKDARVTGKRAVKWSLTDWSAMGLSYGDVLDIKGAIQQYNENNAMDFDGESQLPTQSTIQKETDTRVSQGGSTTSALDSVSAVTLNELSGSANDLLASPSNEGMDQKSSPNKDSSVSDCTVEAFDSIRQFFPPNDFAEMSDYDKQSYVSTKELYEHGLQLGLVMKKPHFMDMKQHRSLSSTSSLTVVSNTSKDVSSVRSIPTRSSLRNKSLDQGVTITASPSGSTSSCSKLSSSSTGSWSGNQQSSQIENTLSSGEQSSQSGSTLRGSEQSLVSGSSGSSNSSSSRKLNQPQKKKTPKKTPKVRLSEAELVASLPSFDVETILRNLKGSRIKAIKKKLDTDGIVYDKERKFLMRVLTKWLHYEHVKEIRLVTMDMKEGLAASIVHKYPLFKDDHPTKPSWWRILDREGPAGYIANCCINILRSAEPSERLRGGGKKRSRESDEEEEEEEGGSGEDEESNKENSYTDKNVGWMNLTMPYAANKSSLMKGMEDSFAVRRKWILNMQPTVAEVLSKYLHLMSFGGEMLVQEFELIHSGKGMVFTQKFPLLIEKIEPFIQEIQLGIDIEPNEATVLKACFFTASSLPRPNLARYRRYQVSRTNENVMPELDSLVQFIPAGCNIQTIARERRENSKGPVQPYLLAMLPGNAINKIFIVADSKFIELSSNSLVFGFDMLFKAYHIFNVQYPLGWKVFWEVVEHGVVGLDQHRLSNSGKEFLLRHGFALQ